MARTHYRNGQDIGLTHNGCDGCKPATINGRMCHETGCPDAWKDSAVDCHDCGCGFRPQERFQRICDDCANPLDDLDPMEVDAFEDN